MLCLPKFSAFLFLALAFSPGLPAAGTTDTFGAELQPFGPPMAPLVNVSPYTLQTGDTVTSVAKDHGLLVETVLSYNHILSPRFLRANQTLRLPNRDGLLIALDQPTPVATLATNYQVFPSLILLANGFAQDTKNLEGEVFVPGAQVEPVALRKLLGENFFWPTTGGRISSRFGRRNDPFTGLLSSHSGVDIAIRFGSPVLASGDGVVTNTGYSSVLGNYIRIDQGQGFASVYGHLSAILTRSGRRVLAGQQIGRVGSTGYSTGPHLHFSAYRWDRLIDPMTLFG